MSRYIDAEALIERLNEEIEEGEKTGEWVADFCCCKDMINEQSTIDVIEVVRCKDCIHNDQCKHRVVMWVEDPINTWHKDIDFCSYGERKEQEHE